MSGERARIPHAYLPGDAGCERLSDRGGPPAGTGSGARGCARVDAWVGGGRAEPCGLPEAAASHGWAAWECVYEVSPDGIGQPMGFAHMMPVGDLIEHEASRGCVCQPGGAWIGGFGLQIHTALDRRPKRPAVPL